MSLEKTNNTIFSITQVAEQKTDLKVEIEHWVRFFDLRDKLEWPINVENLEDYQMAFENLAKNYYKQEWSWIPDTEVERVYQLWKQRISTLSDILDALIEQYNLKNPKLNKNLLYKSSNIAELMNKLWYSNNQLLDDNFFQELSDKLWEAIDNSENNSPQVVSNITNPDELPKNWIQIWLESLGIGNDGNTLDSNQEKNSLNLLKTIVKLENYKITSENFESFKDDLFLFITLIDDIKIDNKTIEIIRWIARKFFDVILIKNILLDIYPEAELSDLLKKHQKYNKKWTIVFDDSYLKTLGQKTWIRPNIYDIIMDDSEKTILSYLDNILKKHSK